MKFKSINKLNKLIKFIQDNYFDSKLSIKELDEYSIKVIVEFPKIYDCNEVYNELMDKLEKLYSRCNECDIVINLKYLCEDLSNNYKIISRSKDLIIKEVK